MNISLKISLSLLPPLLLLVCPLKTTAQAQQLSFQRDSLPPEIQYKYVFNDASQRKRKLNFQLSLTDVQDSLYLIPKTEHIDAEIKQAVSTYLAELNNAIESSQKNEQQQHLLHLQALVKEYNLTLPSTVRVWLESSKDSLEYGYRGSLTAQQKKTLKAQLDDFISQLENEIQTFNADFQQRWQNKEIQAKADKKIAQIQRQALAKNYLITDTKLGFTRLDYQRIARQYENALQPLALSLAQLARNERKRIQISLNLLQSIPYSVLTNRDRKGIAGFVSPPALIHLNQGDCDTKSTALSAIMANLAPDRSVILVLIPTHAFLGIALPPKKNDATYLYQGLEYVLMETAGPALSPIGTLSAHSQQALEQDLIQQIVLMRN